VRLEHLDTIGDELRHVRRRPEFGIERRRPQGVVGALGEVARPVVHERSDARLVRIRHGRELLHSHGSQLVDALLIATSVGDGPGAAEQRSGGVEVGPHLREDRRRHEVRVDVEQARQAELGGQHREVDVGQRH